MGTVRIKIPAPVRVNWWILYSVVLLFAALPYATPQFAPPGQTSSGTGADTGSTFGSPASSPAYVFVPNPMFQSFTPVAGQTPMVVQQGQGQQQRSVIMTSPFMTAGQDGTGQFIQTQGGFQQQQQPMFMVQPTFQQQSFQPVQQTAQQPSPQAAPAASSTDNLNQEKVDLNTRALLTGDQKEGSATTGTEEKSSNVTTTLAALLESKSGKEGIANATDSKLGEGSSVSNGTDTQTNKNQTLRSIEAQPTQPDGISKTQLFTVGKKISDPTSLAALKSQVKLSRFQIWWLTNQILPTIKENLRPDYVFMFPAPFQQGIPTINITQVMTSAVVRPEVVRALIDNADGMLKSQLAVIIPKLRLNSPMIIKDIMSSKKPAVILSMFNPREIQKNLMAIIKTVTEMPETGRFGITSVQTKLLPATLLTTWLHFFNTTLTGLDLLGQSSLGAKNELQLALLGLTCADVRTLPAKDIVVVVHEYRRELYNLRVFQPELEFPTGMRRCILEKVLEMLASRVGQGQGSSTGSVLDNFEEAEIRALGGEVLTAVPTAALKQTNTTIRTAIIKEIARLDLVTLLTFVPMTKLEWLAGQLTSPTDVVTSTGTAAETPPLEARTVSGHVEALSTETNATSAVEDPSKAQPADSPAPVEARSLESQTDPTAPSPDAKSVPSENSTDTKATSAVSPNVTDTKATPVVSATVTDTAANKTEEIPDSPPVPKERRTSPDEDPTLTNKTDAAVNRDKRALDPNDPVLDHLGGLFCYSSDLISGSLTTDKDVLRDFMDQKEDIGEKTCCLTQAERTGWSKFLKTVYGDNVTAWDEFDLVSIGDLLMALNEDEINAISLESLSRVATTMIRRSGLNVQMRTGGSIEKKSFIKACVAVLDDQEADVKVVHEFMAVHKAYMRKLAQAVQWMVSGGPTAGSKGDLNITCPAIIMAGPAALGYSFADLKTMSPQDMFDCIEPMGLQDFDEDIRSELIAFFKEQFHLSSQQLNILTLIEFGNLVTAIPTTDLGNISLVVPGALDIMAVLGEKITDPDTLKTLASKFVKDNHLTATSFTSRTPRSNNMRVTVRSMGNILCGLPHNLLSALLESDAGLMLDTSPNVGTIQGCNHDSLTLMASHAIRATNYGPPETWTVVDVRTIGVVVAGLAPDRLSKIPPDAMEGLTALAVKSFTSQSLQALTTTQISRIAVGTALAMDFSQVEELSKDQKDVLKATIAASQDNFLLDPAFVANSSVTFTGFGTVGVPDVAGDKSLQVLEARSAKSDELLTASSSNATRTETANTPKTETANTTKTDATDSNSTLTVVDARSVNETALTGNETTTTAGNRTSGAGNDTMETIIDTQNKTIDGSANDPSAAENTTSPPSSGDGIPTPSSVWPTSSSVSVHRNSLPTTSLFYALLIGIYYCIN